MLIWCVCYANDSELIHISTEISHVYVFDVLSIGQEFPLVTNKKMVEKLQAFNGTNVINGIEMRRWAVVGQMSITDSHN